MTTEFTDQVDTRELDQEYARLRRVAAREEDRWYFDDPLEGLLDDDATEEERQAFLRDAWERLEGPICLIAPEYLDDPINQKEVREWRGGWWLARRDGEYFFPDLDDIGRVEFVRKEASDANERVWRSLETPIYAVVRDRRGPRGWVEPELVRHWRDDQWLSLMNGVCEVWPATRIDDLELVPEAERERPRPQAPNRQVQDRIAARLQERGLRSIVASDGSTDWQIAMESPDPNQREVSRMAEVVWNSLHTQVYAWVRSCQIDGTDRQVRRWHAECWIMRLPDGLYRTISTSELDCWGRLVRIEDWERSQRARSIEEDGVDWRVTGF